MSDIENGESAVETQSDDNYIVHSEEMAKEAKAEADAQDVQPHTEESESHEEEETEEAPVRQKNGYKQKLEKERAEKARIADENAALKEQLAKYNPPKQETKVDADLEPTESDFETPYDYFKALSKWEARQVIRDERAAEKQANEQSRQVQALQAKVERVSEQVDANPDAYPDFDEKMDALTEQGLITQSVANAVLDCDNAADVAYHLANNPQELKSLMGKSDAEVIRYIAKLEAKLEAPVVNVRQTRAAAPISPIKNSGSGNTQSPDKMDFEDYKKQRAKEERAARGF